MHFVAPVSFTHSLHEAIKMMHRASRYDIQQALPSSFMGYLSLGSVLNGGLYYSLLVTWGVVQALVILHPLALILWNHLKLN